MKVLSLNCGSSSVKYMLYDSNNRDVIAKGIVERIAIEPSFCTHKVKGNDSIRIECECPNHSTAIKLIIDILTHPQHGAIDDISDIAGVGHRVVHGGDKVSKSVIIDDKVLQVFKDLEDLAPLHNPPNVLGIVAARKLMPNIPQVAVMDTTWHQTLLPSQYIYSVPYEWYEKFGIRRYGFHGSSLLYVAKRAAVLLGKDLLNCNLISLHIGNGASANAVKKGISFDTSMGFTPLEGLVMGTRAGDHDAALEFHIIRREGYSPGEIENILNTKSGLLGITGKYSDIRDVIEAANRGERRAELALGIETYRIKKYIGAYAAALGNVDALIWTGGVSEMADAIRAEAMDGLEFFGIYYNAAKNKIARSRNAEFDLSSASSKVKIFVIPTDEELVIAEDVVALIEGRYDSHTKFKYSFSDPNYRNTIRDEEFVKELGKKPEMAIALAQPLPQEMLTGEAKKYAWWLK